MSFDMNKLMQQAAQMQEQVAQMQEDAKNEVAESSVGGPPSVELEQLQEAWTRTIVPAVAEKSIPTSSLFGNARPAQLEGDTLVVEFPSDASFNRKLAEEPKNAAMLRDALYELTGRKLELEFAVGEGGDVDDVDDEGPAGEERIIELMKETFDAREREADG